MFQVSMIACSTTEKTKKKKRGGDIGNELSTVNSHLCPRARTEMMGITTTGGAEFSSAPNPHAIEAFPYYYCHKCNSRNNAKSLATTVW